VPGDRTQGDDEGIDRKAPEGQSRQGVRKVLPAGLGRPQAGRRGENLVIRLEADEIIQKTGARNSAPTNTSKP